MDQLPASCHIRTYCESDHTGVVALWDQVFVDPAPRNEPGRVIAAKTVWDQELFFVAEIDGRIVGTVMAGYDGHRGWLYTVAVAPSHRRMRIGAALIRHAEAALQSLGCVKINLQVLSPNIGAVTFYQRLGYHIEERISMGKTLD